MTNHQDTLAHLTHAYCTPQSITKITQMQLMHGYSTNRCLLKALMKHQYLDNTYIWNKI